MAEGAVVIEDDGSRGQGGERFSPQAPVRIRRREGSAEKQMPELPKGNPHPIPLVEIQGLTIQLSAAGQFQPPPDPSKVPPVITANPSKATITYKKATGQTFTVVVGDGVLSVMVGAEELLLEVTDQGKTNYEYKTKDPYAITDIVIDGVEVDLATLCDGKPLTVSLQYS